MRNMVASKTVTEDRTFCSCPALPSAPELPSLRLLSLFSSSMSTSSESWSEDLVGSWTCWASSMSMDGLRPRRLVIKFRAFDLVYPSRNTSYDTDISYLKDFADVDTFVNNFKNLDPEAILNKHISSRMNSEWNQSGLSMGRIFALKIYLSSHTVNYRTE